MLFTLNSSKADNMLIKRKIICQDGIYKFVFSFVGEEFYLASRSEFPMDTGIRLVTNDCESVEFDSPKINNFEVYHRFYYSSEQDYAKILIGIKNISPDTLPVKPGIILGRLIPCDGHFDYVART